MSSGHSVIWSALVVLSVIWKSECMFQNYQQNPFQQMPQMQQMQQMPHQMPQHMPRQMPNMPHMQGFQQFHQPQTPAKPAPPKRINYMTPCQYLSSRPTQRAENTCPFEIEAFSGANQFRVERGRPVQLTIKPWENSPYLFLNYTDFMAFAVPTAAAGAPGEPYKPLGVFDMDPRYQPWAAGAKGFKCNRGTLGHDAVGSIEEYTLGLYRSMFPSDGNLQRYTPRQRLTGMYLWYPTEGAMKSGSITFKAKLKVRDEWCELTTPAWPVYNPPSPEQVFNRQMQQYRQMQQRIRAMEQQARAAEAQAPAKK